MNTPHIFISATSGDLRSARQVVKEALLTIHCHPVEQTNFTPDWRSVTDMLRAKIQGCQALIHLVGNRYGAEPDPATLPPGTPRRSYTQIEYHLAHELGLRVYIFLLPDSYPYDIPGTHDTPEQTALQSALRAFIENSPHLYERPNSDLDLRTRIIALQEQVISLVQEQQSTVREVKTNRRWGVWAAAAIFFVLGGIGTWQWQTKSAATAIATGQTDLATQMSQVQEALSRIQQNTDPTKGSISQWPQEYLEKELARQMNLKVEDLRTLLSTGKTSLDALIAGQALLASGKQDEAGQKFDAVIAEEASAIQRLKQAYSGKAQIATYNGRYEEALTHSQKAAGFVDKAINPITWASDQEWVTLALHELARYSESEPLKREILHLREQHLGPTHNDTANALRELAALLQSTNRLAEAEPLIQRALDIHETNLGPHHPTVARDLCNLAALLQATNHLEEAKWLMWRVLDIFEAAYGKDHPYVAAALRHLAVLLQATNEASEAESLVRRALKIDEASFGPDHPDVARDLNNLAELLKNTPRLSEIEPMYQRAIKIAEVSLGPNHPDAIIFRSNLAQLFQDTNRLAEAEPLMQHALKMNEASYGLNHPHVAICLNNLARLFHATNRLTEALPLYERALKIEETTYGPDHPEVARILNNLAQLLKDTNRHLEAETMCRRALKISEASFGPKHPTVAIYLTNLAGLLYVTNRFTEAEPMYRRALKIAEASLGPDHPEVAEHLNSLALLLHETGRFIEAEPLYRRALKIYEARLGPDHSSVAICLNNLARLCQDLGRTEGAELLYKRAISNMAAFWRKAGHEHPNFHMISDNYYGLLIGLRSSEEQIDAKFRDVLGPELASTLRGPFLVTIVEIIKDGQGATLGLKTDDVLVTYNGKPITSEEQFDHLVTESKDAASPLEVLRTDKKLSFSAKPGKLGISLINRPLAPDATTTPVK